MAAALSVSGVVHGGTATVTLTGDASSTARMLHVTHADGTLQNIPFTTNGSGGATVTFVPSCSGSFTIAVLSIAATVVSTTANSSHF